MTDEKDWLDPDAIELDPNGPKLEVSGPLCDPEGETDKAIQEAFMAKQTMISDPVARHEAANLGWSTEQIEALMDIRHGRGFWC